jgi:uncharacterized membrane protein YdfJ with MMPL/SSD domain
MSVRFRAARGPLATVTPAPSAGLTDQQVNTAVDAVRHEFAQLPADRVLLGGFPILDRDIGLRAKADLARAEAIALPIVLILLGFALRSAIGSLLGLSLVLTTVTGALAMLLVLSTVTELSTFAINAEHRRSSILALLTGTSTSRAAWPGGGHG